MIIIIVQKVRAITLKGDTIHRNGNMSGGSTDRVDTMDDDAFAEGEIEKLRSRRTELREEVGDLERKGGRSKVAGSKRKGRRGGGSVWEVQLESVRAEIGTTENRLQATESLHKQTLDKLKKKRKELSNVEKELRKLRPNLQRLQADVTTYVFHIHVLLIGFSSLSSSLSLLCSPPRSLTHSLLLHSLLPPSLLSLSLSLSTVPRQISRRRPQQRRKFAASASRRGAAA